MLDELSAQTPTGPQRGDRVRDSHTVLDDLSAQTV